MPTQWVMDAASVFDASMRPAAEPFVGELGEPASHTRFIHDDEVGVKWKWIRGCDRVPLN